MKKFKKIYIEITNACNLNCPFCQKDDRKKHQLSKEEFELILNKIDNYTDYLYLHVKGEPLLHSDFANLLAICKKHNKKVNITTNGTLLYKRVQEIINSGVVRQVNISLHSLQDTNIKDLLANSKQLAEAGIYVVFRFWVYSTIQNDIIENITKYFNCSNLEDKIKTADNIKICNNVFINKDKEFIWPDLNNQIYRKKGTCLGLKTHIGILSNGTVIPCCLDGKGIINLGNIFEEDLDEILNKERTKQMLEGFNKNVLCEELCQKCGFKR